MLEKQECLVLVNKLVLLLNKFWIQKNFQLGMPTFLLSLVNLSERGGIGRVFMSWKGYSEGFPQGETIGKSGRAAKPAQNKTPSSQRWKLYERASNANVSFS